MQNCNGKACDNVGEINNDRLEFLNIGADAVLRAVVILATGNSNANCLSKYIS